MSASPDPEQRRTASRSSATHGAHARPQADVPVSAQEQPPTDDGLYELSEDPDLRPAAQPSLTELERMARTDGPAHPPAPADSAGKKPKEPVPDAPSRPTSGPESHFSGEQPKVVDPAAAANRREEERIRGAEMFAAEEARRKKVRLVILAVLVLLAVGGYFLLRSVLGF